VTAKSTATGVPQTMAGGGGALEMDTPDMDLATYSSSQLTVMEAPAVMP